MISSRYDPPADDVRSRDGAPPRILVVDDDPAIVRLLKAFLVAERFDVVGAYGGAEALERVREGGVDLVLLDIRMPDLDGLEVCRRIRADPRNARLPIVFVTAESGDAAGELEGLRAGGDEYLTKPVHRAALIARVKSLLRLANAERDRQLMAQLAQSEKLAAIGQIAAGVAHEINNPLSFMLSNLSTLQGYLSDVRDVLDAYRKSPQAGRVMEAQRDFENTLGDVADLVAETAAGGQRVRAIVQSLKSFSRTDEARAEHVDLADVARSTLLLTERELSSRATLSKELGSAPVSSAPRNQLEQVVLNLLVNAMQALGGKDPHECTLRIATGTSDGHAWLSVADSGCGMPPEVRARVFEPFFTTKPVGVGTGMGLSFCANVIRKLGGEITVDSEVGRGTTFTLRVPLQREALLDA